MVDKPQPDNEHEI